MTNVDPETGEATTRLTGTLVETEKTTTRSGVSLEAELHPGSLHTTIAGVGVEATVVDALIDYRFVDFSEEPEQPSDFRIGEPGTSILNAFAFESHSNTDLLESRPYKLTNRSRFAGGNYEILRLILLQH